jgi:tetratricopeptide (TPR) repeat protein
MRFLSMWRILFDSLANALLPLQLNARYLDRASSGLELKILLGMAATGGLSWVLWKRFKAGDRRPLLAVGWFGLTWLPVSNLVSISTMMADRYLYLPGIALWSAAACWLARWPRASGALLLVLAVLTMQRNYVWRDSISLWTDSVAKEAANPLAQCSLGLAHYANADFADAATCLQRAYELDAGYDQTRLYLGHTLDKLGQGRAAEPHYRWVLGRDPDSVDVLVNLAIIRGKAGDLGEAELLLRRAIAVDAEFANAHNNLGNVLRLKGDTESAAAAYREAIRLRPDFVDAHHALGTLLVNLGQFAPAVESLTRALSLNPQHAQARQWLKVAQQGMKGSADGK